MRPDHTQFKYTDIKYNLSNNICIDNQLKLPTIDYKLNTYPDEFNVYYALGTYYNISLENICIGYGLGELIQRIYLHLDIKSVNVIRPTWPMSHIFLDIYNIKIDENSDVLYIANPNGVDGSVLRKEQIIELLNKYRLVILDEAYMDFSGHSMINYIKDYDNLIILKTFSKSLAMPGLRFGYCFANKKYIDILQLTRPSCVATSFTVELVPKLLPKIQSHVARMKETKYILVRDYNAIDTSANFVLFKNKPNIKNNVSIKEINNMYRMSLFSLDLLGEIFEQV